MEILQGNGQNQLTPEDVHAWDINHYSNCECNFYIRSSFTLLTFTFSLYIFTPKTIMGLCTYNMNAEARFLIFEAEGIHQLQQDLVLQGPRTLLELELGIRWYS